MHNSPWGKPGLLTKNLKNPSFERAEIYNKVIQNQQKHKEKSLIGFDVAM